MKMLIACSAVLYSSALGAQDLGINPFAPGSIQNTFGSGNFSNSSNIKNSYGTYGSPFSNTSVNNSYGADNIPGSGFQGKKVETRVG